uniref:RING-type E3 ubiquitin transferase n=1 Tax=Vitis vinifera TaxID=29760 RepID=A5ARE6_VITVI|nr:hypothetical protein VITISV_003141 [Vitis vinifera]
MDIMENPLETGLRGNFWTKPTLNDPSQQFHSRGLDSSTVYSLPIAQFKKNEGPSHSNTDCAVCLGEFEEGEFLKHLPNCSHVFHIPCIDTWFESHSNCPLCRSHVYDFTMDNEFSGSMYTLLETLRREDFFQEWIQRFFDPEGVFNPITDEHFSVVAVAGRTSVQIPCQHQGQAMEQFKADTFQHQCLAVEQFNAYTEDWISLDSQHLD